MADLGNHSQADAAQQHADAVHKHKVTSWITVAVLILASIIIGVAFVIQSIPVGIAGVVLGLIGVVLGITGKIMEDAS